jgi:hypothetical protein
MTVNIMRSGMRSGMKFGFNSQRVLDGCSATRETEFSGVLGNQGVEARSMLHGMAAATPPCLWERSEDDELHPAPRPPAACDSIHAYVILCTCLQLRLDSVIEHTRALILPADRFHASTTRRIHLRITARSPA